VAQLFLSCGERRHPSESRGSRERDPQLTQVDHTIEAPIKLSERGKPPLARAAARRLPWGSVAAVFALLLMSVGAIGFYWTGVDPNEAADSLGSQWLSGYADFFSNLYDDLTLQILFGMALLGFGLERLIPAGAQPGSNRLLNIPYSALVLLFVGAIFPLQILIAETITGWLGVRNIFNLNFDTGGSIPFVVLAMLVEALVVDFFFYWFHRCQHTVSVMWQIHMLHHSDMALNVTTTHRVHFLEHVLTPFFMITPIMLLFELPDRTIYWIAIAPTIWSYVVHANIRVGFGRFWWLLSSPQYHRIHHSIEPEHRNKNFAVWFPFYDVMFGSAWRPRPGEFPETGVQGVEVSSMSAAFMLPFARWWSMAKGLGRLDLG
jgi:sterol desaturase/sphingolipid hydroxylase (fatty acid hydroxylase superfamily)